MAKVVKFPVPTPEKFGPQRVRKKKTSGDLKPGQLNLFSQARVIRLNQLSPFEEALVLDDAGHRDQAKKAYYKAISEQDSIADAFCNLGILECQEHQYAKAIDSFTQSLKHDPRHYEAHYNLANLYAEIGNLNLAKIHYETAITLEPTFPNSYFNLGLTLAMDRDFRSAVQVLDRYKQYASEDNYAETDELIQKLMNNI